MKTNKKNTILIHKCGFNTSNHSSGEHASWQGFRRPVAKASSKIVELWDWQKECASYIISSSLPHGIINSPTGSGKSKLISSMASEFLSRTDKKIIIAVPQKVIGNGFTELQKFKLCNGEYFNYRIEERNNLCKKFIDEKSKVGSLIRFLGYDACINPSDRIILCTHQTIARTFENLKKNNRLELFDNTILWVDEAHHVMNSNDEIYNKMGDVSRHYIKNEDRGLSIYMVSATLFRSDCAPIIPKKYESKFARYNLPYDRHFKENCDGLVFSYDFLLYDNNWIEAIELVFKDKVGKTIVFIPHPNHRASSGHGKHKEVKQVIWAITGRKNCELTEDENGIIHVDRNGEKVAILDVVNEKEREKKLEYLKKNPDKIDVVIGINIPKEGFDWDCANREVIIGHKNSLNELIQMMGRTFRYHPNKAKGKTPVEIIQVIPWVNQEKLDKEQLHDQLNDFMKAIYATLILELVMSPVDIEIPNLKKSSKEYKNKINSVQEYIKDNIHETELFELLENIICRDSSNIEKDNLDEGYIDIIKQELSNANIDKFQDEISALILASFKRRTCDVNENNRKSLSGIDVSHIDIDIVKEYGPLGFLVGYTNNICSFKSLEEFRDVMNNGKFVWEKRREEVVEFIRNNDGKFPSWSSENDKEKSLGIWCSKQRTNKKKNKLSEDQIKSLEEITGWKWETDLDAVWQGKREEVVEFIRNNDGKFPSGSSKNDKDKSLGLWCMTQRTNKKKGDLSEDRIASLEEIIGWKWDADAVWQGKREEVFEFIRNNNGKFPSWSSENDKEKSLGKWCVRQRTNKKKNKLSEDRITSLEEITGWKWETDLDAVWQGKREEVFEFIRNNNGKFPSTVSNDKEEKSLGNWCVTQRKNKKKGDLSEDQITSLEEITGWVWDADAAWQGKREEVAEFIRNNDGKFPSKVSNDKEEKSLGMWCSNQRANKKKNKLSEDQIKSLEEITGWVWDADAVWQGKREEVFEFIRNNDGKFPSKVSNDKEEKSLGNWCMTQRTNKKKGDLSEDQIKSLEEITGWKWDADAVWQGKREEVFEFIRNNDGKFPSTVSNDKEEKSLGMWCSNQRANKKKNKLSEDQIKSLEEITGWKWETDLDAIWQGRREEVFEFIRNNDGKFPSTVSNDKEEKSLWVWCMKQRANKKKNKLSEDQIKSLEEITGWKWETDLDAIWQGRCEEVFEFIRNNDGEFPSGSSENDKEKSLGKWCSNQRANKKKNKLSEDQIKSLEEITGWVWDADAVWQGRREELDKFLNNIVNLPSQHSKDDKERSLGQWCMAQKAKYKNYKLKKYQIESLEKIDDWEWSK
jgi:superfamily II DNA or RNA helicase